jgi:hypothetical protein
MKDFGMSIQKITKSIGSILIKFGTFNNVMLFGRERW